MKTYNHYNDFPMDEWRWPSFTPREMRSKGDNMLGIDGDAMHKLQALRDLIGKPIKITSAYRSPSHNNSVGGAKASKHLKAIAFDCQMAGHDPAQFEAAAREVGFTGFGFYRKSGFIHIDTGPEREWYGKNEKGRWFVKADGFVKTPHARPDMAQIDDTELKPRKLIQSTTMQASVVAGVSGITGVSTAVAKLDGNTQIILSVAASVAGLALLWIVRERIKRWGRGDK